MEVKMTHQDPNWRRDRDLDPSLDPTLNRDLRTDRASTGMWGWIAGIAFLVLMLVFLFGSGTENTRTSDNINRSPAAPMITAPADNAAAPTTAPTRTPAETTGQGQR
jgi:hypothetical protein